MRGIAKVIYKLLPAVARAKIEFYARPSLKNPWGGPFNGQQYRQELVKEILGAIEFGQIVETGTYTGCSTEFLGSIFDRNIYTSEVEPKCFHYSRMRLKKLPNITISPLSSVDFLRELIGAGTLQNAPTFFYLDAHWQEYLPLEDEIRMIEGGVPRYVVMIDDFEVHDDPGYRFDDYGPGKALTLDYLAFLSHTNMSVFYPSTRSEDESRHRRGCVVLTNDEEFGKKLESCRLLRPVGRAGELFTADAKALSA